MVIRNILVATAFDEASGAALDYGRTMARAFGGTLHVFHAVGNAFLSASVADPRLVEQGARLHLEHTLTDEDRSALSARAVVATSDFPAEAIVDYAREHAVDLIVTGTHGRTGVSHAVLGSIAERVVRTAPCPVLTVKGGGAAA
jgi:nucleotide-binding universal stress UspA family protein